MIFIFNFLSKVVIMNHPTTVSDWLTYMSSIHVSAIDMGLSRVLPVAEKLDLLAKDCAHPPYIFTVAGTNGKGSTTALISEICTQAGYKTALYQSPHLISFNERIKINGVDIDDEMLMVAFGECEKARIDCGLSLSFFEMTTLAAFWIFRALNCEVWVLEIGLGGRLDVVNIIDPDVCVITNVGIDHTDWLGDDREKIGFEKAGIIRHDSIVIYGEHDMPKSVAQIIHDKNATCHQYGRDYAYQVLSHQDAACQHPPKWLYTNKAVTLTLPTPNISIINASTAISAVLASELRVELSVIMNGLKTVRLAGRFDKIKVNDKWWVFDVGHNKHGIAFLMQMFLSFWNNHHLNYPHARLFIVFSMLADKDIDEVLSLMALFELPIKAWYIGKIDNVRAIEVSDLKDKLTHHLPNDAVLTHGSIDQAVKGVERESQKDDVILCFGSFHTIGESMIALGLADDPRDA